MKKLLVFFLIFFISVNSFSQKPYKIKINSKEFFTVEAGYKEAVKNLRKGMRFFRKNTRGGYRMAVKYLLEAKNYNPEYASVYYALGISYLMNGEEKDGFKFLDKAFNLKPDLTPDIHLWLARAYHLNSQFEEAIDEYLLYKNSLDEKELEKIGKKIDYYVEQCNNGVELKDKELPVIITNLGNTINTEYPEYAPVFAPFDSIVYFTSRRPSEFSKKRNIYLDDDYFEDIYYTSYKNGKWHKPALFPKPLNSKGNDASVSVNPYGTELIIRRGIGKGTFMLVKRKNDEKWKRPKKVIRRINRKRSMETTLTFSRDSSIVYFVSDRPGGYGGKDIWVVKRSGSSGWSKPKNLGNVINTPYDEEAVFIAENDSVLYFASKGLNSIGGYDIFRSYKLPDGRWTEPENLGFGINTPEDDLFIYVNRDGRTGYFTSKGHDGYGDFDIFDFFFYKPKPLFLKDAEHSLLAFINEPVNEITLEPPVVIKTLRLTVIKGIVSEYGTNKPLNATIEIVDNATQEVVQVIKTNATTGEYIVMLPSGKNYGMSVNSPGHMFYSENFDIPAAQEYTEIQKDILLMPIDPGSKIVLRNVFFDLGKATLKPESYPELNRLAEILKRYPGIVVEVSGHTDNTGSYQFNMKLSQRRAESVVLYLISQGVPSSALVAKGYGPTQPVAPNATPEGRALNRRVEVKVLVNPYSSKTGQQTQSQ